MLAIIAHHSVVNSGIADNYDFSNITANMVFLQLWGMCGKTAINVFVMITGYFMCTSKLTWKRFLKMWMEAKFYKIIFFIIFLCAGYEVVNVKSIFKLLFGYIYGINGGFVSSFLVFYLFIPFLNVLIERLDKEGLKKLIALLLGVFTIAATFFFNSSVFHYVFWYITLYFVAAYIRLYPNRLTESKKFAGKVLLFTVILAYISVFVVDFVGVKLGFTDAYYMVSDSSKLFAFVIGVSAFCFFKNLSVRNSKFINTIASTTFGVLLIHANSDAMRQWLWKDFLNLPSFYSVPFLELVIKYVIIMICVFVVCSLIDLIRIRFIENPVFNFINEKTENIEGFFNKIKEKTTAVVQKIATAVKV